jgi:hypothetical protein
MPPVEDSIGQHIDFEAWQETERMEVHEQQLLGNLAESW